MDRMMDILLLGQAEPRDCYVNGCYYRTENHQGIVLALNKGVTPADVLRLLTVDLLTTSLYEHFGEPRFRIKGEIEVMPAKTGFDSREAMESTLRSLYFRAKDNPKSIPGFEFGDYWDGRDNYNIMAVVEPYGAELLLTPETTGGQLRRFIEGAEVSDGVLRITKGEQLILEESIDRKEPNDEGIKLVGAGTDQKP